MKKNMGSTDVILRTVIAIVIAILFYFDYITGYLGIGLLIFAIILLVTSLANFCPLYTLFGINTCKTKQ